MCWRETLIAMATASLFSVGCTDTDVARFTALGDGATIELYSGGRVAATFTSTGKVHCTEGGICDFMDAATGKLVRTTGDIVVRTK